MLKLSLKSILSKKNDTTSMIASLIERLHASIWIEDNSGNILLGNRSEQPNLVKEIEVDNEVIGFVKGDESSNIIATILDQAIKKEAEKKKLGSEVLNLYQE